MRVIMSAFLLLIALSAIAYGEETIDDLAEIGGRCSGLPSRLIKSVIYVESKGNPYAVNINGIGGYQPSSLRDALLILYRFNRANSDLGLMQVNYRTWGPVTKLTPVELLDPRLNVCLGSQILRQYIDEHGGWRGVGRYNATSPAKQRTYILNVAAAYRRIPE